MKARFFLLGVFWLGILAGFIAVVMLLWNCVLTGIFTGLAAINFWQAAGLFILAQILFGHGFGFMGRKGLGHGFGHGFGHNRAEHNAIREKWLNMTDEERKEFIHRRHGFGPHGRFGGNDFFGERGFSANDESKTEK